MNMSSTDYLDQIAPKAPKKQPFTFNLRSILILSAAAVALIIVVIVLVNALVPNPRTPWQQLSLKLTAMEEITTSSSKVIKNSQLRSLNSDVKLYISNTQRDLKPAFVAQEVNTKKASAAVAQAELAIKNNAKKNLEDARLNAIYDSTYSREMSYQLSTILALYQQLYAKSGPQTKEALTTAYDNLLPTQKAIADFSASNE